MNAMHARSEKGHLHCDMQTCPDNRLLQLHTMAHDHTVLTFSKRIALGLSHRILETILLSVRQCCLKLP